MIPTDPRPNPPPIPRRSASPGASQEVSREVSAVAVALAPEAALPRGLILVLLGLFALVLLLASAACSGLPGVVERPHVAVESTRVTRVDFQAADLLVRFRVDNPNSFGLDLAGVDYEIDVAGRTLFEGDRRQRLTLQPSGSGLVELPLRVRFADVYEVARDVIRDGGSDELDYTVRAGLRFEVPVVGEIRVPAEARGELPVLGSLSRFGG